MSCLTKYFCGCFFGSCLYRRPEEEQLSNSSEADRRTSQRRSDLRRDSNNGNVDAVEQELSWYRAVVPLPPYTAHPMSTNEKTLEVNISSSSSSKYAEDEKSPELDPFPAGVSEDMCSDTSSAVSFPSTCGNTSTATRETPPPPYSSGPSTPASRTSTSSEMPEITPPPSAHVVGPPSPPPQPPPPAPVFDSHGFLNDDTFLLRRFGISESAVWRRRFSSSSR